MKIFSIANFTLLAALLSAAVAGVFSVMGMTVVFSGIPLVGIAVGVVLEFSKLMSVSWLYRYWDDKSPLRIPGVFFTLIVMVLTSSGVFGMLSKAHTENGAPVQDNIAKIETIDAKILREQDKIADNKKILDQLDEQVQKLINYDKISSRGGARDVRLSQKAEREALEKEIDQYQDTIEALQEQKFTMNQVIRDFNAEIGPIKYIADWIYGDESGAHVDSVVRFIIILIVLVLDPMAIYLLICYNYIVVNDRKTDRESGINTFEEVSPRPDLNAVDFSFDDYDDDGELVTDDVGEFDEYFYDKWVVERPPEVEGISIENEPIVEVPEVKEVVKKVMPDYPPKASIILRR